MYNRYTPQSDGSYQKRRVTDHAPPPPPPPSSPYHPEPVHRPAPPLSLLGGGAWDFIQKLLPKDLDTGALLVMVLLLLMAGDSEKEKNSALLTLALYLFM